MDTPQLLLATYSTSWHPGEKNLFFLTFEWNFLHFSCAVWLLSCGRTPLRKAWLYHYFHLSGIYSHWWDPPAPSPEWADLALLASPCVVNVPKSSLWFYIGLTSGIPCLSCNEDPRTGPRAGTRTPSVHKQSWAEGSDHLWFPNVSPNSVLNAVDLLWHKGTQMAHGELFHQDHKVSSIKLLSGQLANSIYSMQLLLSVCGTWNFYLLNIMEFLLAHSLSLMRPLWTATQLLFSLPEILLRVYSTIQTIYENNKQK